MKFGNALNRTIVSLDEQLVRYRYLVGLMAFGASYALFKLALVIPTLR